MRGTEREVLSRSSYEARYWVCCRSVERVPAAVVAACCARVGVPGCVLQVAEWDACVEGERHEPVP
jgi:hypothetical protein